MVPPATLPPAAPPPRLPQNGGERGPGWGWLRAAGIGSFTSSSSSSCSSHLGLEWAQGSPPRRCPCPARLVPQARPGPGPGGALEPRSPRPTPPCGPGRADPGLEGSRHWMCHLWVPSSSSVELLLAVLLLGIFFSLLLMYAVEN